MPGRAPPAAKVLKALDFRTERRLLRRGIWPVAGVDEAGRGPLAGPVAAAAVILDPQHVPAGLNDSKKLSAKEREARYEAIRATALGAAVALASAEEIDALNIRQATFLAMRRALAALTPAPRHILFDGREAPPELPIQAEAIIGGDGLIASIAAASILAKVTRDRLMTELAEFYPAYRFAEHFGYATKAHLAAIAAHGPCPLHRKTFRPFSAN
ncbi:MAG TPA: ribonuclease HII [Methylocella sp.]|nr:ribonuclease HII [Methylocella sp.]